MKLATFLLSILLIGILYGCANNSEDDLIDENPDNVTYTSNIKPIIDGSCVQCHGDPLRNGAPFPMTTYTELVSAVMNRNVIERMSSTTNPMPPSGNLPSATIDLLKKWIDDGFPEQ